MKYNGFKFNKTDEPFAMLNGKLNSSVHAMLLCYSWEGLRIAVKTAWSEV